MSIQNSKSESRIANLNLLTKQYRTLSYVSGPLIFVERVKDVGFGEMVEVTGADGVTRTGQVLEVNHDRAVVQVFTGTRGLDVDSTRVHFTGAAARLPLFPKLFSTSTASRSIPTRVITHPNLSKSAFPRSMD